MRICKRAFDFIQVINENGEVRLCSWLKDGGVIGHLTENSMEEIYHSEAANLIRERHFNQDYSNCNPNACPWVANNNVDENSVDLEEVPQFPPSLYLAYEQVCNYHCVMCTIPDCMQKADAAAREEKLNRVDAEIRKVLPYVKHISAHGLGELFACKHILQMLLEWKPLAAPEECSVGLETNGSLFNERNWAKIANLGQYNLSVHITVLSFDEPTYQELSGTKLPLQNLIDNLHYVKSLREQGIINFLEIATVYQDKNFRTLPEFCRRAIEEFGADYVRLRPYEPWREATMEEWMRDVRNAYHPHHQEFLEVMKDPYLKHPKVHDWGGGRESGLGPEPYPRTRARYHLLEGIFSDGNFLNCLADRIHTQQVVIYGMAVIGKALTSRLRSHYQIPYCIDRSMNGQTYEGIPIYGIDHLQHLDKNATVIVTLDQNGDAVAELMKREGYADVCVLKELIS